ncbi:LysR family transcriptional regulator [Bordetella genomosp. 1]|uniref:LysR family transcriptional regulator n=1 Tax=Bordetella genomosp. 1 TaxID=1395607 RepID=A0A261SGD8_9BORD|nr:LysR family transcriptional regulator [Bordetella genomosp. 1]MDQ8031275.1 LysR family transcriptional regulator [Bordetella sp.]OZI36498.1 LysR family transcriptional regulator [Bordetella genomosp. 1]OZI57958.1 LysR family transcriptional regulator [Bordetella genomosp. 1]
MASFDLDQLRTFVAVADAGSLTAAAPRVFLSQSSVSEQVRKLEERAGQVLFKRSKSGAVLTPAGVRLLDYARRILALAEQAQRDMRGLALEGDLRLAITDYFRPNEISPLLARLKHTYPGLRLRVEIAKSDLVRAAYARGELDVGVAMRVREAASGESEPDPAWVLRREPLAWLAGEAFDGQPQDASLSLLCLTESCSLRQYTEAVLRRADVPYGVSHVTTGVAGLQMALAAGLGVACLNQGAMIDGIVAWRGADRLPPLGEAVFEALPPRAGEDARAGQVRDAVVAHFR